MAATTDGDLAKYLAEGLAAELQCSRDLTYEAKWWLISDVEYAIYKALAEGEASR